MAPQIFTSIDLNKGFSPVQASGHCLNMYWLFSIGPDRANFSESYKEHLHSCKRFSKCRLSIGVCSGLIMLTQWGRVAHIFANKLGLWFRKWFFDFRCETITWTNDNWLFVGRFSKIWLTIHFHTRKWVWYCCLHSSGQFDSASMCLRVFQSIHAICDCLHRSCNNKQQGF